MEADVSTRVVRRGASRRVLPSDDREQGAGQPVAFYFHDIDS